MVVFFLFLIIKGSLFGVWEGGLGKRVAAEKEREQRKTERERGETRREEAGWEHIGEKE